MFHVRKHVPTDLLTVIGKREIWRSLKTDSYRMAVRRSHFVISQIEAEFEVARQQVGMTVDETLLGPIGDGPAPVRPQIRSSARPPSASISGTGGDLTFGEVYQRFMSDPTRAWSARTRLSYETTRRLALSIIGADTRMSDISRATCREFMEALRFVPKSASKKYRGLTPREAAERARREGWTDLISPSNANTYLNKVCVVLNWAVQEEFLAKNHMRGLRLADPVAKREKRLPFSDAQLVQIFEAPLYRGCQNDGHGYAKHGLARPKGTRFWIPLIALYSGMRLNEICQLDVTDVREVTGIFCFDITEASLIGSDDKSLKTRSSERIVPVHPDLQSMGFAAFVESRKHADQGKLFGDICSGRDGFRSTAFSKWFALFLKSSKAQVPRTSFHSFRHNFRDALRQARVDRDIALAIGGWGNGKSGGDASDNYGRGYRVEALFEEISKVKFGVDVVALATT